MPSKTILLVVDDPEMRDALAEALWQDGFQVVAVTRAREALEVLVHEAARPALIVIDLMQPAAEALRLLARQAADPALSTIPVVVLSAVNRLGDQIAGPLLVAVLAKPVRLRTLRSVVGRLVGAGEDDLPGEPTERTLPPSATATVRMRAITP